MRCQLHGAKALSFQRCLPPCTRSWGKIGVDDEEGSHDDGIIMRPHKASWAQPPFVKVRHLPRELGSARAEVQEAAPVSDVARRGVACQYLQHPFQCFGRQLCLLEPHAVLVSN